MTVDEAMNYAKNELESAFEKWLSDECPSGDCESVQRQWDESFVHHELVDELQPVMALTWEVFQLREENEWLRKELARLREQAPAGWVDADGDFYHGRNYPNVFPTAVPVYADPVPAPAVSAANPVQWLEDEGDMILVPRGLLGAACSSIDKQRPAPKVLEAMRHYTMNAPQAPAVPTNTIPEGDDFNGTTPHMIRCIESLVAMNDRGALAPHGLCGHSRTLLLASANRLRQQQAHVVPAVPEEWRDVMQDAHDTFQRYADQHRAKDTRDSHEKANVNQKLANRLYALLQSAEVRHD